MKYTLKDEMLSQAPVYSPGPVLDHENLIRMGFYPEHFKDGLLGPASIPIDHLRKTGVSVDRQMHALSHILRNRAGEQKSRAPQQRQEAYIALLSCKEVRRLVTEDNVRAFTVIDDATFENPAHASIYSAVDRSEGEVRKLRSQLLTLLRNLLSLEEYLHSVSPA
jgi:hypothetical protein